MDKVIREILNTKLKHFRNNCPRNITYLVFLEIEKSYKKKYELAVDIKGKDTVNKYIGKYIRQYWDLKNLGRCKVRNNLISSYEEHSN